MGPGTQEYHIVNEFFDNYCNLILQIPTLNTYYEYVPILSTYFCHFDVIIVLIPPCIYYC